MRIELILWNTGYVIVATFRTHQRSRTFDGLSMAATAGNIIPSRVTSNIINGGYALEKSYLQLC